MTTGSRTTDLRYTDSRGIPKALGGYAYKSWSGGNSPSQSGKLKKLAAETYPGSWHFFRASRQSYLLELSPIKPGLRTTSHGKVTSKSINKVNYDRSNIAEIVRRHREVYQLWRARMDAYLAYRKQANEARKQESTRKRESFNAYDCYIMRSLDVPCSARNNSLGPNEPWLHGVAAVKLFGSNYGSNPWTANDDNALIEKIRSELNGVKGFHAGVALAEFEKTVAMFGSTATVLRRFGQRTAAKDAPGALRVLYNGEHSAHVNWGFLPRAAQLYLGYQFGLKPLMEDVISGAQMLGWQQGQVKVNRIRVRRKVSREKIFDATSVKYPIQYETRKQIVCYLKEKPNALDYSGLTDLASVVWERLMWSFVVDWWFPVGSALSAMQMARKLTGTFITTTTQRRFRGSYSSGVYSVLGDSSWSKEIQVSRVISSSLIAKMPNLKPIFHPKMEVRLRHSLEAGALLVLKRKAVVDGLSWLYGQPWKPRETIQIGKPSPYPEHWKKRGSRIF